ncbi:MAG: polyketide synthase dehydratase domain-containing protein, partial [Bacillus sp. (in: firmicutes)]
MLNFFTKANGDRDEVITELQISDKYLSDLDHFSFHPALVDDAINVPVIRIYSGGLKLLPLSYKNLKFYRRVPNHFYSKIALTKDTNTEVFTFRASLVDMSGNLIAEAEEVTLRQISKMNEFNRDVFYGMNWMLQSATIQKTQNVQGNILVFCDHGEYYARALAERIQPQPQDSRLFFVSIGKEFSQIDETHFTVGEDEEDYDKLLAAISVNLCSVYHFSTVDFTRMDVSAERYGEELHQGLYSVVYLTRALLRTIRDSVDFVLLTDYAHEVTGE